MGNGKQEDAEEPAQLSPSDVQKPKRRHASASKNPAYGSGPGYWNKRYRTDPAPFEWLEGFEDLSDLISEAAGGRLDCDILHVGCGSSLLTESMFEAGYHHIVNIDNSAVAIQLMKERNRRLRPSMQWLEMDATHMTFSDSSFDMVLDKSVLDTFACGDHAPRVISLYLSEIHRVLRPGGVFLCISYGSPASRLEYLQNPKVPFTYREVEIPAKGGGFHFAYFLTKPRPS